MKTRAMVTVSGRVQGVNFRYYTKESAERLNVTGWIKNLPDGRVQGCFEGEESDVAALIDWCRTGPASARVDGVTVEKGAASGEFFGFDVRH